MIFAFRGVRAFQVMLALAALATGVGSIILLKTGADGDRWAFIPAVILGAVFLFLFGLTLRLPTSFVAVAEERTRIRFPGFVDTVIANRDITGARLVRHPFFGGLGVRTSFGGTVALATAWGEAAEITLRDPVRIWVIPKVLPARASRIVLTVRNPQKLVERFAGTAPPPAPSPRTRPARKMKARRSR